MRGKKVSFLFQLRALFPLHQLIGWSTHFLCGFFHHSPAVILHSPSLLRVRQPFVVLGLFFWSGKKLPFASVRMFLPLAMGIYLPSRKYSAMKSPNGKGFSQQKPLFLHIYKWLYFRRPVPSTDQALPSCFYFRIS